MIRPAHHGIEVWLCVEPVDFRQADSRGSPTLVQDTALAMDPFSAQLCSCSPIAGAPSAGFCIGSGADSCCGKSAWNARASLGRAAPMRWSA